MTLKPKPAEELSTDFVVCDIENDPAGNVLDIDTCCRLSNGQFQHRLDTDWSGWWAWLVRMARRHERYRTVWAHNGCGWDWLSLVQWLIRHDIGGSRTMRAVMSGSKLIMLLVIVNKRCTIRLVDSLHVLKGSLDKLGEKFVGQGKLDMQGLLPHEMKIADRIKYYQYLRNDTELLVKVLESASTIIHDKIAPVESLGVTIASTALNVFRTGYLKRAITIPKDEMVKKFVREGYRGGRVELFRQGEHRQVYVYDINSLYPAVMRDLRLPATDAGFWTNHFHTGLSGLYHIQFDQQDRELLPILTVGGNGVYRGEGVYYTPELAYFQECGGKFTIIRGYCFADNDILFRDYVDNLYNLRLTDIKGPLGEMCKMLLNNLYGKFAQRPERSSIVYYRDIADIEAGAVPMSDDLPIYLVSEESAIAHEHVAIAGMITSAARVRLHQGFGCVGHNNVVYCDTDSVHSTAEMSAQFIGSGLGQFKLEAKGRGAYAAKKCYGISSEQGEKIRVKGVRVGKSGDKSELGMSLSFDDILRLSKSDARLVCGYKSAATFRETLRGVQPCSFIGSANKRIRSITRERK